MLTLRRSYGSGPLEEFNAQLYPYRRNVAGAVILTLFAVQSALATKMPLPQFMPSARLAHLRMVNKVREVVTEAVVEDGEPRGHAGTNTGTATGANAAKSHPLHNSKDRDSTLPLRHLAVRRKYLAFNTSSAAQAEIIEFLEELVELAKLLVGANEFRSGLFVRPEYCVPPASGAHDPAFDSPTHPPSGAMAQRSSLLPQAHAQVPAGDGTNETGTATQGKGYEGRMGVGRARAATELPATLILSNEEVGGGQGL